MSEEKEQTTELPEIIPIQLELVPLPYRKAWKKILTKEKEVIADSTIVGPSKVFADLSYPFCISLISPDQMVIIFKMVKKSQLEGGQDEIKQFGFPISRKTWRKDILKLAKKVDGKGE
jgi:hypothetical protein